MFFNFITIIIYVYKVDNNVQSCVNPLILKKKEHTGNTFTGEVDQFDIWKTHATASIEITLISYANSDKSHKYQKSNLPSCSPCYALQSYK